MKWKVSGCQKMIKVLLFGIFQTSMKKAWIFPSFIAFLSSRRSSKSNIYFLMSLFLLLTASLQSCPTLCNPIDGSPTGSPVPGILQARTLEWVAISFSSAWKWKMRVKSLSCVRLFATLWTAAYQAPPSMGLSRQEYWSGFPVPSPIDIQHCIIPFFSYMFFPPLFSSLIFTGYH